MKNYFAMLLLLGLFVSSCDDDDDNTPELTTGSFTVTIQNVMEAKPYFVSGTTGFLAPGESETHTFNAGPGHYLQLATMFVQSNDLFYAPGQDGLPLYDANNIPLTGDISDQLQLWDAGTEVNEEPGTGANQAPRQAGPNTGVDENGTVRLVNDGFSYPATTDIIKAELSHDGGTLFTLTLTNVSANSSLPSPLAPGTWVVHPAGEQPMFTAGQAASAGLEGIAEDGNNTAMATRLADNSGLVSPFAPGGYQLGAENTLFTAGQAASTTLEGMAEDGDASGFDNIFNTPDGAAAPGPIFPGESYSFTFTAKEGDKLTLATMFVQSNDWFVALDAIELFSNGMAISGDLSAQLKLYDAGTETDQYPGAGKDQAPRQAGPDTGAAENGTVRGISTTDFDNVPALTDMLKVTVNVN